MQRKLRLSHLRSDDSPVSLLATFPSLINTLVTPVCIRIQMFMLDRDPVLFVYVAGLEQQQV